MSVDPCFQSLDPSCCWQVRFELAMSCRSTSQDPKSLKFGEGADYVICRTILLSFNLLTRKNKNLLTNIINYKIVKKKQILELIDKYCNKR